MLEERSLAKFLLENGLVDVASIVSGNLDIQDASRRNRNFKVLRKQGTSYFLKQGFGSVPTIEREAAIYAALRSLHGEPAITGCLPAIALYDSRQRILVLESAPHSETLEECAQNTGRMPSWTGKVLGHALGALHRRTARREESSWEEFDTQSPWVFEIHKPGSDIFWSASGANLQVVRIVQESGLGERLDELHESWRPGCLIHGDLKAANVLVDRGSTGRVRRGLQIIDWELAGFGDPAWDVGSVLSDYLALWLRSIPMAPEMPIERSLQLASLPLDRLVLAAQSFWNAYSVERALSPKDAGALLHQSTLHAAARLIQTGYESSRQSNQVTSNVVYLIQLSSNMMARPHAAAWKLLGLAEAESSGPEERPW